MMKQRAGMNTFCSNQQWIPHSSVLQLEQFDILIDYLELKAISEVAKFAVDNNLFKTVKMKADHEELQEDLRKMNK